MRGRGFALSAFGFAASIFAVAFGSGFGARDTLSYQANLDCISGNRLHSGSSADAGVVGTIRPANAIRDATFMTILQGGALEPAVRP